MPALQSTALTSKDPISQRTTRAGAKRAAGEITSGDVGSEEEYGNETRRKKRATAGSRKTSAEKAAEEKKLQAESARG